MNLSLMPRHLTCSADTWFDFAGNFDPLGENCDGAHYRQEALQTLGQRFAESFAALKRSAPHR